MKLTFLLLQILLFIELMYIKKPIESYIEGENTLIKLKEEEKNCNSN